MLMRLIRRRRSRRERLMRQIEDLRKRAPSMPELPERPDLPEVHLPRRLTRDTRDDTPRLSFAGGLLLGLLVGIVVTGVLLNRRDDEAVERRRPTGITLLPHGKGDESQSASRSSAVTG